MSYYPGTSRGVSAATASSSSPSSPVAVQRPPSNVAQAWTQHGVGSNVAGCLVGPATNRGFPGAPAGSAGQGFAAYAGAQTSFSSPPPEGSPAHHRGNYAPSYGPASPSYNANARPEAPASCASSTSRPTSGSGRSRRGEPLAVFGSGGAPPSVARRNASQPFYSHPSEPPSHSPHSMLRPSSLVRTPRSTSSIQHLGRGPPGVGGQCCTCGKQVRYAPDDRSFRCDGCGCTNVVRSGGAGEGQQDDNAEGAVYITPEEAREWKSSLRRPRNRRSTAGEGEADQAEEEEDLLQHTVQQFALLSRIEEVFASFWSLGRSFIDPQTGTLSRRAMRDFFDAVTSEQALVSSLTEQVERLLRSPSKSARDVLQRRPAQGHQEEDRVPQMLNALLILLESPALEATGAAGAQAQSRRHWILSHLLALLSHLPVQAPSHLRAYFAANSTPGDAQGAQWATRFTSLLSSRLGELISLASGSSSPDYGTDWVVKACCITSGWIRAALGEGRGDAERWYASGIDMLDPAQGELSWLWDSETGTCKYPWFLSLGLKERLLRWEAGLQQELSSRLRVALPGFGVAEMQVPFLSLSVRRAQLVQDSIRAIERGGQQGDGNGLKKRIKITFEGEEGIDAGGLLKEWFLLLSRQLFDERFGMFVRLEDGEGMWFAEGLEGEELEELRLVGKVLGLALYNGVVMEVPLPLAAYKKLQSEPLTLSDLASFDPSLARGLHQLLALPAEEVVSLEQFFVVSSRGRWSSEHDVEEHELCREGASRQVTAENREEYVRLLVDWRLTGAVAGAFEAFAQGFRDVMSGRVLPLFEGSELELLVRGSREPLDIGFLKGASAFKGFPAGHEDLTVQVFWRVFESWSEKRQRSLLSFVTGSDRLPVTGTAALNITLVCLGEDEGRLPSSHTCFNYLCLYRYTTEERMRERLETAMDESEGFGLK